MILLDSHVAFWFDQAPGRLGSRAVSSLEIEPEVCFSAVLTMELTIKRMLGRWPVPEGLVGRLLDAGLTDLALTSAHAAALADFPEMVRHDPFDRLYVAQAYREGATLLTSDRDLLSLGHEWIVDART